MTIATAARRLGSAVAALVLASSLGSAAPANAGAGSTSLAPVLGAHDWLNGTPSSASLAGNVVIVDVFTFGCYNCKNVTPNLEKLHAERGVKVIGIHSPETAYEHDRANVVTNLASLGVVWPVAIDNNFALWQAYGVDAWPTQLIFDKRGTLRKTVVGDSQDAAVDATVKALLAEN